jgi:predicted ester cyclase
VSADGNDGAAVGSDRQGKELISYITDEIINGGNLTIARELFSPQYILHKTGLSLPRGPEAFKMAVRQWRDAFPDYRVTIEALFAEGDLIASRFVAEGTHRGALLGVPPTEKSFTFGGTDVHRVVDGLVVESWLADDIARILSDVGFLLPTQSGQWT